MATTRSKKTVATKESLAGTKRKYLPLTIQILHGAKASTLVGAKKLLTIPCQAKAVSGKLHIQIPNVNLHTVTSPRAYGSVLDIEVTSTAAKYVEKKLS